MKHPSPGVRGEGGPPYRRTVATPPARRSQKPRPPRRRFAVREARAEVGDRGPRICELERSLTPLLRQLLNKCRPGGPPGAVAFQAAIDVGQRGVEVALKEMKKAGERIRGHGYQGNLPRVDRGRL